MELDNRHEKKHEEIIEGKRWITRQQVRQWLLRITAVTIGLGGLFIVLEILLRFLPLSESPGLMPVDVNNPVPRYKPSREHTFSRDWNFSIVTRKKTNRAGFYSDFEYERDRQRQASLVAVIGDSYVEALQVQNPETFHGIVGESMTDEVLVYAFGSSGCSLSTYLKYAEWVRGQYKPDYYIFCIVGNDYDESFQEYKSNGGSLTFFPEETGAPGMADLETVYYHPERSLLTSILRHSAVARYLVYNCEVDFRRIEFNVTSGGNREVIDPKRVRLGREAIAHFIRLLPEATGVRTGNIVLILDAERANIYEPSPRDTGRSYYSQMKHKLVEAAVSTDIHLIDMEEPFANHFRENRQKFEFPTDGHWNELGHSLVAKEILASEFWRQIGKSGEDQDTGNTGKTVN